MRIIILRGCDGMNVVEEYICISNDTNIEYRYAYRLITRKYNGITAYGIEVERMDYVNLKNINLERDSIELISTQKHKVKNLLMKLYSSQVSPIHLIDIIGSYVDEYIYEFNIDLPEEAIN